MRDDMEFILRDNSLEFNLKAAVIMQTLGIGSREMGQVFYRTYQTFQRRKKYPFIGVPYRDDGISLRGYIGQ